MLAIILNIAWFVMTATGVLFIVDALIGEGGLLRKSEPNPLDDPETWAGIEDFYK